MIEARVDDGPWTNSASIYPLKGQKVALRVKRTADSKLRWFSLWPDNSTVYKNANFPWDAEPYKWIGLAKIRYKRQELVSLRDRWEIYPLEEPAASSLLEATHFSGHLPTGIVGGSQARVQPFGSFWFQAEVERAGTFARSYGFEDNDNRGLLPGVFRVSVRDGDGYLGFLTSFFNVPGLFGSTPYQSLNYIGVGCADVLVAAYCAWKNVRIKEDHCVASLVGRLPKVAQFALQHGVPQQEIRWGKHVVPGYLIAVKYPGQKGYQHTGALVEDTNRNGLLDDEDLVLHAGPQPLHYVFLKEGKFDGQVVVLKPDFSKLVSGRPSK